MTTSKRVLAYLHLFGPSSLNDIALSLRRPPFLQSRIIALAEDGLIGVEDGRWHITEQGEEFLSRFVGTERIKAWSKAFKTQIDQVGIDRETFLSMIRFAIEAGKKGIPEDEIVATLEVLGSRELREGLEEALKEMKKGKTIRFKNAEEAIAWLHSKGAP